MPSPPMPMRSDVTSVLSLAQSVADDFSRAPAVFSPGERAATELVAELIAYQQFNSSRIDPHPNNQSSFESSLTANLQPCRDALRNMLKIRQKYGGESQFGVMEGIRWRRDEKQFEQEAATLQQDTRRLRELVQELRRSAATSTWANQRQVQDEYRPNRDGAFGAPVLQTIVSISGVPFAAHPAPVQTQRASTTGFTSQNSFTSQHSYTSQNSFTSQTPGPTEMCPNGSGCRRPRCHLDYLHPNAPKCENGRNCGTQNCEKWHPKSAHCPKGPSCPIVGCEKAHPWPREPVSPLMSSYAPTENSFSPTTTGSVGSVTQPGPVVVVTTTFGNGNPRNQINGTMPGNQACPEAMAQAQMKEQRPPQYIAELSARQ
ncbi:hypothetical protein NEMBOFW57_009676 [Staphylotrichum longicolle]|uniref:Uncharacterized protein n=1 Tax=Staphylotrichum longicolle TaxID=669026 RepID=A0AAD4EPF7_9PEZI|nr:hypothetical protein NEMBOFW57_009676 [Staphylotrichum longicolle]